MAAGPRVVSLVPSHSELVSVLGARLVGVTRFCVVPAVLRRDASVVGGTKDPDVERILALRPDVVVVNQEENRREDAGVLREAGVEVVVTFARTVADAVDDVAVLGAAVGRRSQGVRLRDRLRAELDAVVASVPPWGRRRLRVLAPIWRRPWMTVNEDTYAADVLRLSGASTVYAGSADRFPAFDLDDAALRLPDVVLLGDEPYPFAARHVAELHAVSSRVALVDGQALHWYGPRSVAGVRIVRDALRAAVGSG